MAFVAAGAILGMGAVAGGGYVFGKRHSNEELKKTRDELDATKEELKKCTDDMDKLSGENMQLMADIEALTDKHDELMNKWQAMLKEQTASTQLAIEAKDKQLDKQDERINSLIDMVEKLAATSRGQSASQQQQGTKTAAGFSLSLSLPSTYCRQCVFSLR
jgi:chromosome segregation ATPase